MTAYYNEHNAHAAAWLRKLIKIGAIATGEVDERSITDVTPDDLAGYQQCHFFAGIGGWSLALRLAGIPDDCPIWTGSCPCQPYSAAGKGKGDKDERNLWPEFFRLIRECRPKTVCGEQVASAEVVGSQLEAAFVIAVQRRDFAKANQLAKRLVAHPTFSFTRRWLDGICAEMEGAGYAFGCEVLGAHSVGAPHIRQRLYWVAQSEGTGGREDAGAIRSCEAAWVREQKREDVRRPCEQARWAGDCSTTDGMADATCRGEMPAQQPGQRDGTVGRGDGLRPVAVANLPELRGVASAGELPVFEQGAGGGSVGDAETHGREGRAATGQGSGGSVPPGTRGPWSDYDIIHCQDGKARRVGRGVFPLVDGLPADLGRRFPELRRLLARARSGRTGRLKGYGNAIVPQVAAEFVRAWMEVSGN